MDIVILSGSSRTAPSVDDGGLGSPAVSPAGGGARAGWHVAALERAGAARGHRVRSLPFDALAARVGGDTASTAGQGQGNGNVHGSGSGNDTRLRAAGHALDQADAVLVRIVPRGSLEQIVFRMDALHRVEALGIPVVNPPAAIERTVDKLYTSFLLEDAGVPTPRTIVAERETDARAAFRELGGDVVVKPLFGANGRGMVRVTDEEIAFRVFRALELERAVYYVQQTVPHPGRDIRAFVIGGKVIAAAWRYARAEGGWRTNLARGGRAEPAELSPEWAELCVRAAEAVGAEYAGVDLLPAADGRVWVLEVNGVPGWKGVQAATGVDVPAAILRHIELRVEGAR
jgi:RimK family alpha-L-glutamate ligase